MRPHAPPGVRPDRRSLCVLLPFQVLWSSGAADGDRLCTAVAEAASGSGSGALFGSSELTAGRPGSSGLACEPVASTKLTVPNVDLAEPRRGFADRLLNLLGVCRSLSQPVIVGVECVTIVQSTVFTSPLCDEVMSSRQRTSLSARGTRAVAETERDRRWHFVRPPLRPESPPLSPGTRHR